MAKVSQLHAYPICPAPSPIRIVDGDTIEFQLDMGFRTYRKQVCRLMGLDAPEHNTLAGQMVAKLTAKWIAKATAQAAALMWMSLALDDKYGRSLGDIAPLLRDGSCAETLCAFLLRLRVVRQYSGATRFAWSASDLTSVVSTLTALDWMLEVHSQYDTH